MDALIGKIIYLAEIAVLLAAIWKACKAYWSDDDIKKQIKNFVMIAIFLGAAPGLVDIFLNLGETIVSPTQAFVEFVAEGVTTGLEQ
jgi:hypothetical protein